MSEDLELKEVFENEKSGVDEIEKSGVNEFEEAVTTVEKELVLSSLSEGLELKVLSVT